MSSANNHGKPAEKNRSKQHLALGIVIVLIVGSLIVWNNWPKNPSVQAVTIGTESFDTDEVGYHYTQVYNNTYQMSKMYEQYGIDSGYNTTLPPTEQVYDEESGKTYADYFRETALSQLQEIWMLKDQASKAGYSLSEKGKLSVEDQMKSIDSQILQLIVTQGGSESYYLKAMYGENMTKSLLENIITDMTLASEYAEARAEEFTYDAAKRTAYYVKNAADLDSYDYRSFFVAASPESSVDAEGNPVAPTEEQTVAAMKIAKTTADAMAAKVRGGMAFNVAAKDHAEDDAKDSYADPDYSLTRDAQGASLTNAYGTWLKASGRKANQLEVIEQSGSGYYVVQFLAREQRADSLETLDVSSILVTAKTTESTDEAGTTTTAPTEEQLSAAKTRAEEILAQWDTSPDKNAEAFLALVPTADKLLSSEAQPELARTVYGTDFDKWAFAPGAVKAGNTKIVEASDSSGAPIGYRLVLINDLGQSRWEYAAETALRTADYDLWFEPLKEEYPITEMEGMQKIGA